MDDIIARLSVIAITHYQLRGRQARPVTDEQVSRVRSLAAEVFGALQTDGRIETSAISFPRSSRALQECEAIACRLDRNMDVYERHELLDAATKEIPIHELYEKAERLSTPTTDESAPPFEDALAEALVHWFKHSYMRWVNSLPCSVCSGSTTVVGTAPPNAQEEAGQANQVELHRCEDLGCGAMRRFPRYNDPAMLMKTREGRCGEWANLFTLFLRAVGLRARYVWNREDHIWNEYFSPSEKRWVHIDSCEAARDHPMLYEKGWGKKMSYVFAFSVVGARDVSRGYTLDWPAMQTRRNWASDNEIAQVLSKITANRRAHVSPQERSELEAEDLQEDLRFLAGANAQSGSEQPRQSGSAEWTRARGEAG